MSEKRLGGKETTQEANYTILLDTEAEDTNTTPPLSISIPSGVNSLYGPDWMFLLVLALVLAGEFPGTFVMGFTSAACGTDVVMELMARTELRLETNIIIRELAHLGIIDTDDLSFLVAAKAEIAAREVVHKPADDGL